MCRRLAPAAGTGARCGEVVQSGNGYGFITLPEGARALPAPIGHGRGAALPRVGQLVEFGRTTGPRGMQAAEVVVLTCGRRPNRRPSRTISAIAAS